MAKAGRPRRYREFLGKRICRRLMNGESLRKICRDDEMPCIATVCKWVLDEPIFAEQYAKARQIQAELIFEDIDEIADDGRNDWIETNDPDNPGYRINGEHIARSRLRVDTRKWKLARMNPKKYGDRITHAGDETAALTVTILDPTRKKHD